MAKVKEKYLKTKCRPIGTLHNVNSVIYFKITLQFNLERIEITLK